MMHITGLDIPSDPEALLAFLERYEARAEVPTRRDAKDEGLMEEVALDLALSMDVFSAIPLVAHSPRSKESLNDDELERATQALSIAGDNLGSAPPVVFNFLRPRYASTNAPGVVGRDKEGSGTVALPLGVRQLLADWNLGEDPSQFIFRNPYEEHEPTFRRKGRKATGQKAEVNRLPAESGQVEVQTRSRIPVVIASSQMPPAISTQQTVNRGRMPPRDVTAQRDEGGFGFGSTVDQASTVSQPLENLSHTRLPGASSQNWLGPSTQVLPGTHGGRPEANVVRKKQKKRAKGF
jgi:hypothetical protein